MEADDLITIVDITDPDDPDYGDMKTQRRPLTSAQLASMKPMLQKIGAYQFFSKEFNFADGPAVKQFIETVEVEEIKPTKTHKVVQQKFKGSVAGREVVIDSELIEKAFGLVNDGEDIVKPRGDDVSGLHAFYIKPHHMHQCQTKRGVNVNYLRTKYMYLKNLAHQIQGYLCGVAEEDYVKFTVYRSFDLIIRGTPVNWNRYLLQNMQERFRKYKRNPGPLYFAGTLTALIYKALNVNYELVNKPLPITPSPPPVTKPEKKKPAPSSKRKSAGKEKEVPELPTSDTELKTPGTRTSVRVKARKEAAKRTQEAGAYMASETETSDSEPETQVKKTSKKRKAVEELEPGPSSRKKANGKQTAVSDVETSDTDAPRLDNPGSESPISDSDPETDNEEDIPESGLPRRQALLKHKEPVNIPDVLVNKNYRLSTLYNEAMGTPITKRLPLTESKDLWEKYTQYYALGQECHLEHIITKQKQEKLTSMIEEMESALKVRDDALAERTRRLQELEEQVKEKEEELQVLNEQLAALKK